MPHISCVLGILFVLFNKDGLTIDNEDFCMNESSSQVRQLILNYKSLLFRKLKKIFCLANLCLCLCKGFQY